MKKFVATIGAFLATNAAFADSPVSPNLVPLTGPDCEKTTKLDDSHSLSVVIELPDLIDCKNPNELNPKIITTVGTPIATTDLLKAKEAAGFMFTSKIKSSKVELYKDWANIGGDWIRVAGDGETINPCDYVFGNENGGGILADSSTSETSESTETSENSEDSESTESSESSEDSENSENSEDVAPDSESPTECLIIGGGVVTPVNSTPVDTNFGGFGNNSPKIFPIGGHPDSTPVPDDHFDLGSISASKSPKVINLVDFLKK